MIRRSRALLSVEYAAFAYTIAYMIVSVFLGGPTWGIKAGRYYLCSHGAMTEISEVLYYALSIGKWILILTMLLSLHLDRQQRQLAKAQRHLRVSLSLSPCNNKKLWPRHSIYPSHRRPD